MKRRTTTICILACAFEAAAGQVPVRSQVESLLDEGASRSHNRDVILRISDAPVPVLRSIAESDRESYLRRTRAIFLLATFKTPESEHSLHKLADHASPQFRCPALQALAELKSQDAIPMLISKLNDHSVCMQTASTDPAREYDVYVSDEAVRLLEQVTGQRFDREAIGSHRSTGPWKKWWSEQRVKSKH
jgi:HEAT repeat protein